MISNIRFNLMRTALALADKNLHSLALLLVSPSAQGKTDTLEIFAKDHDGVWAPPATSVSRLTEQFEERRNITMIAIDEPYDWQSMDYQAAAMMCKHVLTGKIKPPRSTLFTTATIMAKATETAVVFFCNRKQYDKVRRALAGCGLLERSLTILTQHTSFDTMDYIERAYKEQSTNSLHFMEEYQFVTRDITESEQRFIDKNFSDYQRRSVMWIARVTPVEIFEQLKPYLMSGLTYTYVEEQIKFEEKI